MSEQGVSIAFLDTLNTFKGWKTIFSKQGAWAQYNSVDFGSKQLKTISIYARADDGAVLQIRTDNVDGPVIAEITIPKNAEWKTIEAPMLKNIKGLKNLVVLSKDNKTIEVDWLSFR